MTWHGRQSGEYQSMTSRLWVSSILIVTSVLVVLAKEAGATTFDRVCSITGSGGACIFSFNAIAAGNVSVSTKACAFGQRWRTTIARFNTGEAVSQVGNGSIVAFTGRAVRSTTKGAKFLVIVTLESPVLNNFSGAVIVRFTGPFTTVAGPRPSDGSGLFLSSGSSAGPLPLLGCDLSSSRSTAVFVAPIIPQAPARTSSFRPPAPSWRQ